MSDALAAIPLSAFRVFEAAARQLSFTRAADELGMTQAAVSWQVNALEKRLHQKLFERRPKGVALTEQGERLATAASEALGLLRAAVDDVAGVGRGVLRLTIPATFATLWLAPRIHAFQEAHPETALEVDANSQMVDMLRENFDAAIRTGSGHWPGLESDYLFPATMTPLCTAEFAEKHRLRRPADLLEAPRLGRCQAWDAWFGLAGVDAASSSKLSLTAKLQAFDVAAAISGQVAAMASPVYYAAEIASGRLVQPFAQVLHFSRGYWLVYREERRRSPALVAFRKWLLETLASDPVTAPPRTRAIEAVAPAA